MARIDMTNQATPATPSTGQSSLFVDSTTKKLSTIDDAGTVRTYDPGNVTGPSSSTDNAVARFDSTTGKLIQDSGVTIDDSGNMVIPGNLTVSGTTTTIDSTTLTVKDKNIEMGTVTSPTNTTADGGGITLKGATDKTLIWDIINSNWTSSEHFNIASGKKYKLNNVDALSESGGVITLSGNVTGNAATVTTNANLTGHITSVGNAAVLGSFTSAQLATALTDETGSGAAVFGTTPTFTTNITTPLIIGGTGTTSSLSYKTTSGVGAAGANHKFLVGNNGATEAMTIDNNGFVGISMSTPTGSLDVCAITYNPGTLSVSGVNVTGVSTAFTKTFKVGDSITTTTSSGSETKAITGITSDTAMTTVTFVGTNSGSTYTSSNTGSQFVVNPNGQIRLAGTGGGSQTTSSADWIYKADTITFNSTETYRLIHDRTIVNSTGGAAVLNTFTSNPQVNGTGSGSFNVVRGANLAPAVLGTNTGNITSLMGANCAPTIAVSTTGTITTMTGVIGAPSNSSSTNTITNIIGGQFTTTSSSGTVTSSAGIVVGPKANAATNSTIGLFGTTTIPTGTYGLYVTGGTQNYFSGNTGIGTATPTGSLEVAAIAYNPGTVSVSSSAITGVSTEFTKTFKVGDSITTTTSSGSETKEIQTLSSDTAMTTVTAFSGTNSGSSYTNSNTGPQLTVYPNGQVRVMGTTGVSANNTSDWMYKADTVTTTGTQAFSAFRDRTNYNSATTAFGAINTLAAGPNLNATGTGTFGNVRGINSFPTVVATNTGNITTISSVLSSPQVLAGATGTITNFIGFSFNGTNASTTNTITNMTGLQISPTQAGGTLTNYAGVSIAAKPTAATNSSLVLIGQTTIPSGTYGIYNASTGDNYFAGTMGIGSASTAGRSLEVSKNLTGSTTSWGIRHSGQVQSDVTVEALGISSLMGVAGGATIPDMEQFFAGQGTISGTVTRQYGFYVSSGLTGATSNYGFFGAIASGTNRYNLYMSGTADNYVAGSLAIGSVPVAGTEFGLFKNLTGATGATGAWLSAAVLSDVTVNAFGFRTNISTQATTFTLPTLIHFYANQSTIGTNSTVTNQYGFMVENTLTGATNNYAYHGNIAASSGRWNIYMGGTAQNYFAGKVGIKNTTPTYDLDVTGDINLTGSLRMNGSSGTTGQVLTSAGSGVLPTWSAAQVPYQAVSAVKTTTYSILTTDYLVLLSGASGAFTATLPTAVGVTGKTYVIKRTDDTPANVVTIATTSSQTIDDTTTKKVMTKNEQWTVTSDGANWIVEAHTYPSKWTAFTPTGLWTTNTTYSGFWKREGDSMLITVRLLLSGAPNAATNCTVNLPSNYTIDTAKLTQATGGQGTFGLDGLSVQDSTGSRYKLHVAYESTTSVTPFYMSNTASGVTLTGRVSTTAPYTYANLDKVEFTYKVPITNWDE